MPSACIQLHSHYLFEKAMACDGVMSPPPPPAKVTPSKIGNAPSPQTFYSPLRLEMDASAFFTHGYFQQANVHISEAIITD